MSEFSFVSVQRIFMAGKAIDATVIVTLDGDIAARQLALRCARNSRRRAIICFGALTGEITEIQEVMP